MNTWISVKTNPPVDSDYEDYFESIEVIITDGKWIGIGYVQVWKDTNKQHWYLEGCDGYSVNGITHWMPLPKLPTEC